MEHKEFLEYSKEELPVEQSPYYKGDEDNEEEQSTILNKQRLPKIINTLFKPYESSIKFDLNNEESAIINKKKVTTHRKKDILFTLLVKTEYKFLFKKEFKEFDESHIFVFNSNTLKIEIFVNNDNPKSKINSYLNYIYIPVSISEDEKIILKLKNIILENSSHINSLVHIILIEGVLHFIVKLIKN